MGWWSEQLGVCVCLLVRLSVMSVRPSVRLVRLSVCLRALSLFVLLACSSSFFLLCALPPPVPPATAFEAIMYQWKVFQFFNVELVKEPGTDEPNQELRVRV
jgi:hypothetical protein